MKVVVLYHPDSDHGRMVEDFGRDFKKQTSKALQLISLETKDGAHLAELYDVMNYPAILVTKEDGELVKDWQGLPLPLIDEVAGYGS